MSMSSSQLAASIRNTRRDQAHARRMATDPAYAARIEREQREYEQFCAKFGPPE